MAKKAAVKVAVKVAAKPVAKVAAKPAAKPAVKSVAKPAEKSVAKKKQTISQSDLMKHIQDRAYFIWLEKGKPEGNDYDNYKQAEAEIKAAYNVA